MFIDESLGHPVAQLLYVSRIRCISFQLSSYKSFAA